MYNTIAWGNSTLFSVRNCGEQGLGEQYIRSVLESDMNRAIWLRIPFVLALSLAIVVLAEPGFAQHGGHGGGSHSGGFHGGGGFGGSHGGSGFHGGGGSFHGGG